MCKHSCSHYHLIIYTIPSYLNRATYLAEFLFWPLFWKRHSWTWQAVTKGSYKRKISKRNKCWFHFSTCENLSDSFLLHQWASILVQNENSVFRRSWGSQDWLTSPAVPINRAEWKEKWSLKLWGTGPWRTQSLNCILQMYTFPSLLHSFNFWKRCYFLIQQFKNSSEESSYVVQEFTFQGKKNYSPPHPSQNSNSTSKPNSKT